MVLSGPDGSCAVGDAKYKDVLERAADERLGTAEEVLHACIQSSDWYQLYVCMRVQGASSGFFVVPFWNADGVPCELLEDFRFSVSPCNGAVRVAVLALNLLKPLTEVKKEASERLRGWLS